MASAEFCKCLLAAARSSRPPPPRQSTYCDTIKQHCDAINRPVHVVNLGGHYETVPCLLLRNPFICAASLPTCRHVESALRP